MEYTTPDERMMELWQDQMWRVNYLLRHAAQFEWVEVEYREALQNPEAAAARIAGLVDGLNERAMVEVVDPALYRNRAET